METFAFSVVHSNSASNYLQQPDIEFLSTSKFGMLHTGSRQIPDLGIQFYGNILPNFNYGITASNLFGDALHTQPNSAGYVYLNTAGASLSFSGNGSSFSNFTIGSYVLYNSSLATNEIWYFMINSQLPAQNNKVKYETDWRIGLRCIVDSNSKWVTRLMYSYDTNSSTAVARYDDQVEINQEDLNYGWRHVAVTFDGIKFRIYIDGLQKTNLKNFVPTNAHGQITYVSVICIEAFANHRECP